MADNVTITAGAGTTIAADDIGGVLHQRVKLTIGADGTAVDASAGAGAVGTGVIRTTLASDDPAVTSLALMDDVIFTDDAAFTPATSKGMAVGFEVDDTGTDSVDEGDFGVARMSANRNQYIQIRDSAANERGANVNASNQLAIAGPITVVSGGIAAGAIATGATSIAENEDVASASADTGVKMLVIQRATPADTAADLDYSFPQMSAGRIWTSTTITAQVPGVGATNLGKAEDAVHADGDTGVMALAVRKNTAASTSGADGDYQPLITDTNGRLHVIDSATISDDSAFTPATTGVTMAGFTADETATDSVDEGDGGAARMTLDRKIIVTEQPHTSGGLTTMNASSCDGGTALTNTSQVIKASAGQLYGYYIYNPNAAAAFVCFYNTASASVTVGTTNPLFMLTVPPGSAANLTFSNGVTFSNAGWSWAATSTAGGNGALTTALDAVVWYA